MDDTPHGGGSGQERRGARVLLLLCMSQFMLVLDVAIASVALPPIQADLGFSRETLQLVVTAYGLTFGGLLLLGGQLGDVLGRRSVFVSGLALFTLASLACGLAPSAAILVGARALQGVGAALVSPAALALLTTAFSEGEERNRALGVWSAVAAGGGAAGLVLGGALTDLAGWRWVFLVNVPVGALVAASALRALPEGREARGGRLDVAGAATATAGLIALVYGLGRGAEDGFDAPPAPALLGASAALLTAFVAIERRAREPLVPFGLVRLRTLAGANLATLLMSAVVLGVNFFLTLYFQQVLGYSPFLSGLAFLPMTAAIALTSTLAARFLQRAGPRTLLVAGMLALALGSVLLARVTPGGSYLADVLPGLLLVAAGLGPGFTVGTVAATAGVPAHQQGAASGILNTSLQVGGAIGLAVLSVVAGAAMGAVADPGPRALTDGFRAAFLAAGGFAVAAALAAGLLVRERDCREELERRDRDAFRAPASGTAQLSPCQPAVTRIAAAGPDAGGLGG